MRRFAKLLISSSYRGFNFSFEIFLITSPFNGKASFQVEALSVKKFLGISEHFIEFIIDYFVQSELVMVYFN